MKRYQQVNGCKVAVERTVSMTDVTQHIDI